MFNVAAPHCPKGSEPEYLLRRGLRECVNTPTDGRLSSSDYYLRFRGSDTLGDFRNKRAHIVADIFLHMFFNTLKRSIFPRKKISYGQVTNIPVKLSLK